jgi:DNA-binding LytR/AlgR family response regulator
VRPGGGLSILAVDDEPRALADVKRLLETSAAVEKVETATSAKEALVYLSGGRFDALFLDVAMPEIEGMALARLLRRFTDPPAVVFLTGHPDAAVEAFEVQALDFLIKPVTRDRLDAALARVQAHVGARGAAAAAPAGPNGDQAAAPSAAAGGPDVVAVDNPEAPGKRLVRLENVRAVQANGDYARILAEEGSFLLRTPLAQLERDWGPAGFVRVHRAYLVNLKHAVELRAQLNGTAVMVLRDGTEIPVARRNVAGLRRRLHA